MEKVNTLITIELRSRKNQIKIRINLLLRKTRVTIIVILLCLVKLSHMPTSLRVFVLLFFAFGLMAQPDSVSVEFSTEEGILDSTNYQTEVGNGRIERTTLAKSWVKLNMMDIFPRFVSPVSELPFGFSVEVETPLSNRSTINFSAGLFKERYVLEDPINNDYTPLSLLAGVEIRRYIKFIEHPSPIKWNGHYIAANLQSSFRDKSWYEYPIQNRRDSYINTLSGLYGVQTSVGKSGFFDFSFGLGYSIGNRPQPFYDNQNILKHRDGAVSELSGFYKLRLGFAFFNKSQKFSSPTDALNEKKAWKAMFRAHIEEKRLFKLNLVDLFKFQQYSATFGKFASRVEIAYEQKLTPSFSLYLEGVANMGLFIARADLNEPGNNAQTTVFTIQNELALAPRWYYQLRKNIAKGLSVNNFSADYISIFGRATYRSGETRAFSPIPPDRQDQLLIGAVYGVQRRIFKNGFFDFQIGLGRRMLETKTETWFMVSDLKVGFAF